MSVVKIGNGKRPLSMIEQVVQSDLDRQNVTGEELTRRLTEHFDRVGKEIGREVNTAMLTNNWRYRVINEHGNLSWEDAEFLLRKVLGQTITSLTVCLDPMNGGAAHQVTIVAGEADAISDDPSPT